MIRRVFPIEVGKTVFITPVGNAKRGWNGEEPFEGTIDSIARKYFYVKRKDALYTKERFDKETFECKHEDCNSSYLLWETKEAWYSYRDAIQEARAIQAFLSRQNSLLVSGNRDAEEDIIHALYRVLKQAGLVE